MMRTLRSMGLVRLAVFGNQAPGLAQSFADGAAQIPQGTRSTTPATENVDFADVDIDGDWDAIFADGGDSRNDQNRLWINQGGAQGGTLGVFIDVTRRSFPRCCDTSRDVDFVDFDNDGDNDSTSRTRRRSSNQSNRWWINQGGLQAGTTGLLHRRDRDALGQHRRNAARRPSSVAPSFALGERRLHRLVRATATSATSTTTATSTSCTRATAAPSAARCPRACS